MLKKLKDIKNRSSELKFDVDAEHLKENVVK